MKKKLQYISRLTQTSHLALASLLLLPLSLLASCSDKEETDVFASKELSLNMTLTPTVVDLPARNASQDITITSNTAWGAVSDVTWAKLSATLGVGNSTLSVLLEDNTSTEPRTATITFSYGNTQQTVTINQAAVNATLSSTEVTLPARDASQEIGITTNSTWTVSTFDTWIHILTEKGDGDGKITFTLDNNPEIQTRQGKIIVAYGQGTQDIIVNQDPATASLSTQEVTLGAKSASQDIKVTSNATWSAESDNSWIHIEDATGEANGRFTITVDDNKSLNNRQGKVTFTYGNGTLSIVVKQEPAETTKFEKVQANNVGRYQADITGIFNSTFDVTEYGIVYSAVVEDPTLEEENANIHKEVISTTPIAQNIVSATIKGLKAGSKNYARIYTKGPLGTEYSPVVSFVTSGGSPSSDDNPTPGY